MRCPHCLIEFHENAQTITLNGDIQGSWELIERICPSCQKKNISLICSKVERQVSGATKRTNVIDFLAYPRGITRTPCPPEVPQKYAVDYVEACLVLVDSPKASAALSRRCLQHLIRDELKVVKPNLAQEIDEVINNGLLPADILESIDAIRNIGNFAAHPIKSTGSGEIVEVEPGEAEWNLDVLEMMFDYLFVRPAKIKLKKDALNKKLSDAGKPPVK